MSKISIEPGPLNFEATDVADGIDINCTVTGYGEFVDVAPTHVMQAAWSAWAEGDLPNLLSWFKADIVWALHLPREVVPYGGDNCGRAAVADALAAVSEQFETVSYQPILLSQDGAVVRGQVRYCYRHRVTGEVLEGVSRHVCTITDGLVSRIEEFHDVDRVRAFMQLVAVRGAELQIDILRG